MQNIEKYLTDDGRDVKMQLICGCENAETLDKCEQTCLKYYDCYNVALANDILAILDNQKKKEIEITL